jgi:transcriptional regulator with XRE-family HTH domain
VPRARIPALGDTVWSFRRNLEISRATAYRRHGISPSYLAQIEKGERVPSTEMVDQLVMGYDLNRAQAQYLHDLRAPSLCLEPTSHSRRRIFENKQLVQHLEELERRGVLAAYIDPLKQILATNHIFRSGLPGLHEAGSIPLWMFGNAGQETVIDWPGETNRTVASLRPALARYSPDSPNTHVSTAYGTLTPR